jgi:hypothetical protein
MDQGVEKYRRIVLPAGMIAVKGMFSVKATSSIWWPIDCQFLGRTRQHRRPGISFPLPHGSGD